MIKRGVLLLLFLFSFSFVSGYTISSVDTNYEVGVLIPGSWFTTAMSDSVRVVVELDSESSTEVNFYCQFGRCSSGEILGTSEVIDGKAIFDLEHADFLSERLIFYTDLNSDQYRIWMQSSVASSQSCVSGCTGDGIVEYYLSTISSSQSCDDYILSITDYSLCSEVNEVDCSDFGAYDSTNLISCADYSKFALIDPCGGLSDEFVYFDGAKYFQNFDNVCSVNANFLCEGKDLYQITTTGNFDEDLCGCEVEKTLKETCIDVPYCDSGKGVCNLPNSVSSNLGAAVLDLPKKIIIGETANLLSNIEVTWEVLDENNTAIVFNEKAKELTLSDLEIGTYKVTADGQVNYFDVITCNSDSNCNGQICVNPGSVSSECRTKICSNNEDCYRIVTKISPLAYDIKCVNPYSIDSYCDYKNITCKIDADCTAQVPEGVSGVKCLNPGKIDSSCQYADCDVKCKIDLDCDDGNQSTIDICQLPSTCQAVCLNKVQFEMISPAEKNYLKIPELNFELYNVEQCKFKLNGNYETITRLPISLKNTIEGNNTLVIECDSFTYDTWFTYGVEEEAPTVENQIEELKQVLSNDKIKQIDKAQEKLKDVITVQNTIEEINGTSQVTTSLDIKENLTDLEVYLQIPKCMAESVAELEFDNEEFNILIDDPLIMWHFKEAVSQQDLIYRVKKQVSEECFEQLKVMTSADFEMDNSWWIYVAIIPVIFIVYSYFSKFAVAPESEEGESDAVKNYVKLLRKRVEKLREEFSEDRIRTLLEEEGIDDALIDKAMSL